MGLATGIIKAEGGGKSSPIIKKYSRLLLLSARSGLIVETSNMLRSTWRECPSHFWTRTYGRTRYVCRSG